MEPAEDRPDDVLASLLREKVTPPQWSRPKIGRMTRSAAATSTGSSPAAMEPAEDRPDDASRQAGLFPRRVAAMEPAEDRPDDSGKTYLLTALLQAAMEPAEDRPDDRCRRGQC